MLLGFGPAPDGMLSSDPPQSRHRLLFGLLTGVPGSAQVGEIGGLLMELPARTCREDTEDFRWRRNWELLL